MSVVTRKQNDPFQKQYKYQFTLEILRFICEIPLNCTLRVMWKRNNRSIQTKNEYEVKAGINELPIKDQKMSNLSTYVYNTQKKQFQIKSSQLIVNMFFNGSPKKLAVCPIDTRCVLDGLNIKNGKSQTFEVNLTPCIKNINQCKITYRLTSSFKQEVMESQRVIPGGLNTSGYSISHQLYERKYEVPSKDNISVASYNPSSRYPSANKRDRDDSSVKRNDYGVLAGLKSNISNQFTGGTGPNDFDTKSGMKSIDNQSNMTRVLGEEQRRRSKVEAELSKCQVELGEIKKRMNELAIQNAGLKQQIKSSSQSRDNASKEELNSLQFKQYQLNNEVRQLRNQLQNRKRQSERLQSDNSRFKVQRSQFQKQLSSRQLKIEDLQRSFPTRQLQTLQSQNNDLKYQLDNLRRFIQDIKSQHSETLSQLRTQKYRETQQLSSKLQSLKLDNQKIKNNNEIALQQQRKINQYEQRLITTRNQLSNRNRSLTLVQKQSEEYKRRLIKYQDEKSTMHEEIIRLKQDQQMQRDGEVRREEIQERIERLSQENVKLNQQVVYYQGQFQEAQGGMQRMRLEQSLSDSKNNKLLPQINQLQKKLNQTEGELFGARGQIAQMQDERQQLQNQLSQTRQQMFKSTASIMTNPEMDLLNRQKLQMQVDLKYANDQLGRMRGIEESLDHERWRAENEHKERVEIEERCQQIEKELTLKKRSSIIEAQKVRVITQQMNEYLQSSNIYKQELQKQHNLAYNLEQELSQINASKGQYQHQLKLLQQENNVLRGQLHTVKGQVNDELRQLQEKNRQLEGKNIQLEGIAQGSERHSRAVGQELKQLHLQHQALQNQFTIKDKTFSEMQMRSRELQRKKGNWQSQISRLTQQRRQLQKRNEMVMQQIHTMKKKFEQQKGRSLSFTRNEEFGKVRSLECDLQKKERVISKLNKEKLQLQQENVKVNVQVMKLLSQMEKLKANGGFNTSSSFKSINSLK